MSGDLEAYAAHCRKMATTAQHRPDCQDPLHTGPDHRAPSCRRPGPDCTGCVTLSDRALWLLLAEEAETYLRAHEPETLPL